MILVGEEMGQILKAECECGFKNGDLFVGGGKASFETLCSAPVLCEACGHFFTANYFNEKIKCPQCAGEAKFYDDPSLRAPDEGGVPVFSWDLPDGRKFLLPGTKYQCPECKEVRMRFSPVGAWD
jgi:hypothetical protein